MSGTMVFNRLTIKTPARGHFDELSLTPIKHGFVCSV